MCSNYFGINNEINKDYTKFICKTLIDSEIILKIYEKMKIVIKNINYKDFSYK